MMKRRNTSRGGAILVCVIACLVVSSVLVALAVQSALHGRREARLQLQLRQTELLCEAGVMRAMTQLQRSGSYEGEQWHPDLNLENYHHASVEIAIKSGASPESASEKVAKRVTVTARLDSNLDHDGPMQRTHQFDVPIQAFTTQSEN